MARTIFSALALLLAVAGGLYQLYLRPILTILGQGRTAEPVGNKNCVTRPELQACEKIILHQPSGTLYLACSNPASRTHWIPAVNRLNVSGASFDDYVATYDHKTSQITHLKIEHFSGTRGLSVHGMDVVPSSSDPSTLFVYLVNHRKPLANQPAHLVGADSCIEIFKTEVRSSTLTHLHTVEHDLIITPNDVVGSPDGQSFHFTNDRGEKVGLLRELEILGRKSSSVGYCHVKDGCKLAITGLHGSNGITRASNGTFYVADSLYGGVTMLERQVDNSLVVTDSVKTDRGIDNLSVDADGMLWGAGFVNCLTTVFKHFSDPSVWAPSSAFRISINTGPAAFFGEKYKVDKPFEDDGEIASGITSVVYDSQRRLLFLHGLASPQLAICEI